MPSREWSAGAGSVTDVPLVHEPPGSTRCCVAEGPEPASLTASVTVTGDAELAGASFEVSGAVLSTMRVTTAEVAAFPATSSTRTRKSYVPSGPLAQSVDQPSP